MSTIDNYLLADGTYPDEWPQAACDLVDILREHEDRDRALITKLEAKLEAMGQLIEQVGLAPVAPEIFIQDYNEWLSKLKRLAAAQEEEVP